VKPINGQQLTLSKPTTSTEKHAKCRFTRARRYIEGLGRHVTNFFFFAFSRATR
jgi:hypothetical protein